MTLSRGHSQVADLLERNPQAVLGTAAEVGKAAGVNQSTVVRYAIAAGYSGWTEMQQVMRAQFLAGLNAVDTNLTHADNAEESPIQRSLRQDLANLRAAYDTLTPELVTPVVESLVGARRIVVAASGSYAGPATVLAHLMAVLGLPAQLEDRSGVNLGAATANLGSGDVLVAVNLWRQTTDLVAATEVARGRGATVVAITDTRRGVATAAEYVLLVPSESASFFQSTTAAVALVYGLVTEIAAAMGKDAQDALQRAQEAWEAMRSLGPLDAGGRRETSRDS